MSVASLIILNELEIDALTELVNLGVSRAAGSLRDMVGEEVILSVPGVELLPRAQAIDVLAKSGNNLVAVHQVFEGDVTGRAMLIFPETKSLELVRAVTNGDLALEEIIELEQEALAEIGNVILNGCLATMANMLQRSFKISLPEILHGDGNVLFNLAPPPVSGEIIMFIYINFAIRSRDIQGYIAMLMDMPSMVSLKELLIEFIARTAQDTAGTANA